MNRVLEATNSSLRQQLHLKIRQLGQSAEDLQGSRRELAQSQEALEVEQRAHQAAEGQLQAAEGQLQACQTDSEKTKETLKSEEQQRRALEQKLSNMENRLKPFFKCRSSGVRSGERREGRDGLERGEKGGMDWSKEILVEGVYHPGACEVFRKGAVNQSGG